MLKKLGINFHSVKAQRILSLMSGSNTAVEFYYIKLYVIL